MAACAGVARPPGRTAVPAVGGAAGIERTPHGLGSGVFTIIKQGLLQMTDGNTPDS
jgi:hypothetical protein